jgi:ParB family transcriptional regulator, chromosome partitioning protein
MRPEAQLMSKRLKAAVEKGLMPHTVAICIARAKNLDMQNALADGYEAGTVSGEQILAIRRILEQRDRTGKIEPVDQRNDTHSIQIGIQNRAANSLLRHHRKETDKQKLMIRKAALVQSRLLVIVSALKRLFAEERFKALLRAEGIHTIPKPLAERINEMAH